MYIFKSFFKSFLHIWYEIFWVFHDRVNTLHIVWLFHVFMQFLPGSGRMKSAVWMHNLDANQTVGKEANRQLHKNAASNIEQVLAATPHDMMMMMMMKQL